MVLLDPSFSCDDVQRALAFMYVGSYDAGPPVDGTAAGALPATLRLGKYPTNSYISYSLYSPSPVSFPGTPHLTQIRPRYLHPLPLTHLLANPPPIL